VWDTILELIIVLLVLVIVWRFVARTWVLPHQSTEPDDEANVLARIKPRPTRNAGAVALEEPDDEEQ
jgi:hypothetical protein